MIGQASCWVTTVVLVACLVGGCRGRDTSCDTPEGGISVRYVGQAYGYGTIEIGWNADTQQHRVSAQMMGPDSVAELRLSGEGTCEAGVLRARLGGGRDEASGFRVLGGSLVVLFDHDPMSSVTGFWEVRLLEHASVAENPDGKRFRGLLEQVDRSRIPEASVQQPGEQIVDEEPHALPK